MLDTGPELLLKYSCIRAQYHRVVELVDFSTEPDTEDFDNNGDDQSGDRDHFVTIR